jgi:H+/Cl- antiporter ClcA
VVTVLGLVGYLARALVAGLAGVFLVHAAIQFDPDEAKGVDATLRSFADTPAGPWLLTAVAVGLLLFAGYCLAEARWRRV